MTTRQRDRTKDNGYQKLFIKKLLRYLPHHLLLAITHKVRLRYAEKLLGSTAQKRIITTKTLRRFSSSEIAEYQKLTQDTQFWHGTGRWQHGERGTINVLKSFCDTGGLKPARDVYAVFGGSDQHIIHSISLCRSRMVARSYADMHGLGWKEKNRYGDALTWTSYYYSLFYARLFTVSGITMLRRWKTWRSLSHDEHGDNTWGKKVNRQARDVWDIFCLGSDIPGNYPILIGVKELASQVELEKPMRYYEVRADRLIAITNISHIEVPYDKQEEVHAVLLAHNIALPVTSIELGECVSAKKSFTELLGWSP
ncbi:hypothetical protein [Candidatus Nanosynbacter featherlites]|uniref:Uncharacterized protein n=1 Tax=Candidatus Nanosynbacter featherlites TaxID=2572088 RepID=A0A4P9A3K3_9BACT|nr:hypothetical protein [Candidatus Nanosynbacter featherlites]QCT42393.1 hypothetical protein FBF37_02865 [Candidatus Nanosynbacter featherlites]